MMKRALIIDDDEAIRALLKNLLEHFGWASETCGSPQQAREHLNTPETWDLVLCDVNMPDGDGIEFISSLSPRQKMKIRHIMLMSGDPRNRQRIRGWDLNFMDKPFSVKELLMKIQDLESDSREAACESVVPAGA